jgi:SARP family transcriptional regulator, regulator of embCAB operon
VRAFDGDDELALGPVKQRAVLAVLLLNANRPVSAAQIVTAVWQDEPPGNGTNVVQKYVAGLRRVLEPERTLRAPWQLLTLTDAGYVLKLEPGALDADAFHDRVRRAAAARGEGRLVSAAAELQDALALWRADALAGLTGPVFDAARDRLSESRAAALESWAEAELELGRHAMLVPELVRLVAEYPLREQLRYHLMLALYRTGRQAEALAAYRDARAFFVEEFGAEPGEPLQQLHQRILRSDPTLAAPSDSAPIAIAPPMPPAAEVPLTATVAPIQPGVRAAAARKDARWLTGLGLAGVLILSLCGFGYFTWLLVGIYAIQRRSWPHVVAAVVYLGFSVTSILAFVLDPTFADVEAEPTEAYAVVFVLTAMVPWLFGSIHLGLLGYGTVGRSRRAERERRARREQALQIVRWKPELARELLIGRPDLPRQFDDGGLVDVNAVPGYVIATLPGVTTYLTQIIVADREIHGPYASVEHMVSRQMLTPDLAESLRGLLIFGGSPDGERRPQAGDVQHA